MATNATPIFVFVPGAWHTPDTFDIIRDLLRKRGYESATVAHQSLAAANPSVGLHADIANAKRVLQKWADQGRQIVVVAHSYGGLVAAGAVEGLGHAQRASTGQPGGVIQVVWLAAFVVPRGKSLIDMLGGSWLPWMLLENPDDGYCYSSQHEQIFYHDMTPEAQQQAIAKLKPHPKPSFLEPAVHEPWHEIPAFYLFCDQDQALPMPAQEAFARTLGNPGTYHADGSHSAFISVPEQVADGLELALREGLEKSGVSTAAAAAAATNPAAGNRVSQL
ncbi:alpha/beta hydrolase [Aspergillus homomorphus CBS 101889]|uniref:Alpha/beta-hydrolase n=1 Tax=Aspergillus homomorphus (strain CBS 101889) TaxID=1450537 RepID=A0A395I3V1_ASPHC|nr:alpha/beta-hydrolase [Aspergillus homomorphus CBS 101889]RAL13868.1 alpha/beta-hydrolase [Aspergillus homomorphus CBS 101889]